MKNLLTSFFLKNYLRSKTQNKTPQIQLFNVWHWYVLIRFAIFLPVIRKVGYRSIRPHLGLPTSTSPRVPLNTKSTITLQSSDFDSLKGYIPQSELRCCLLFSHILTNSHVLVSHRVLVHVINKEQIAS